MCKKNIIIITIGIIGIIIGIIYKNKEEFELKCTKEYKTTKLNGYVECRYFFSEFKGNFKDSKRNGYGEYKSSSVEFKGDYSEDVRYGKGKLLIHKNSFYNKGEIEG
jgi:hypothetical protein